MFKILPAAIATTTALSLAVPAFANEVNVYSYRLPELLKPLTDAFTAETGIAVNVAYLDKGMVERLQAEGARSPAELVLTVDISRLSEVVEAGLTTDLDWARAELALRSWLNELFVRPRFKELAGHTLAVVALLVRGLPAWLRAGLLTAGVVAQATILNSFSHFHTPLVISLQRTVIALVLGFAAGLLLSAVANWATGAWQRWLDSASRFDGKPRS